MLSRLEKETEEELEENERIMSAAGKTFLQTHDRIKSDTVQKRINERLEAGYQLISTKTMHLKVAEQNLFHGYNESVLTASQIREEINYDVVFQGVPFHFCVELIFKKKDTPLALPQPGAPGKSGKK